MKRSSLYPVSAIKHLINSLSDKGYDCYCIDEGVLGMGHWICLSNTPHNWNFEIKEVYLNEWSSAHTIRRFKKLSKRQDALIESTM